MGQYEYKLIKDRYLKNRGGHSQFLTILCASCKIPVLLYQKDGFKGQWLKRLYVDRIHASVKIISKNAPLICPKCHVLLGTPMIYQKENRPAIHIIREKIIRKPSKGVFPLG